MKAVRYWLKALAFDAALAYHRVQEGVFGKMKGDVK